MRLNSATHSGAVVHYSEFPRNQSQIWQYSQSSNPPRDLISAVVQPAISYTMWIEGAVKRFQDGHLNKTTTAFPYVWGDVNDALQVRINGKTFLIGHNLYAALEQLRRNRVDSWLWADSISIHQSDLKEKSW
ncbi:hypothetical protein EDB80DRAFT_878074 [Ilyonectria destructans]|nr:hypothetical protein EDB80DRAFT_878074 [Ilyonectria destructans]